MNTIIILTGLTFNTRSTRFRNLIIAVVALGAVCIIPAVILLSWLPLWGLILLIPLCGGYLFFDARLVDNWRRQVLTEWAAGKLDLDVFIKAVTAIPSLPQRTLQGMLATLPSGSRIPAAGNLGMVEKVAVAETLRIIGRCQSNRPLALTLAVLVGLAAAACASVLRTWQPLWGLLGMPLIIGMHHLFVRTQLARLGGFLGELGQQGLTMSDYLGMAQKFDWSGIAETGKKRFFRSLVDS